MTLLLILALLFQGKPAAPFSDPNDPEDPGQKLIYDVTVTVPKNGKVVIWFETPFERQPSCSFEGGTLPGERSKFNPENNTVEIKAKRGAKLHYRCAGIKRELAH